MYEHKFELDDEQNKKVEEWRNHCSERGGYNGNRVTFSFSPTGLGMIVSVECVCGEKLDLTDFDSW